MGSNAYMIYKNAPTIIYIHFLSKKYHRAANGEITSSKLGVVLQKVQWGCVPNHPSQIKLCIGKRKAGNWPPGPVCLSVTIIILRRRRRRRATQKENEGGDDHADRIMIDRDAARFYAKGFKPESTK
jgi:hypothetical protein